jgi:LysR family cys regulon transcriptional activator
MNLQQLRYIQEVARRGFSVSEAALALHTSQPGVSRQIRLLEDELGVEIFVRRGKKLLCTTDAGHQILDSIGKALTELRNLRRIGEEFSQEGAGSLTVATTHTQARYALPQAVHAFRAKFPGVHLALRQGSPEQLSQWVLNDEADLAIATESLPEHKQRLVLLPGYQWHHLVIAPTQHPIHKQGHLTLASLVEYPLVTYDAAFTGRRCIDRAFAAHELQPHIVLSAIDADIIKTYVKLGLGVGIVACVAFDPVADKGLRAIDAAHLFETCTTRIGVRTGAWLRSHTYAFIEMFAPHLTRKVVEATLAGHGEDAGL